MEYFICDCGCREFIRIISLVKDKTLSEKGQAKVEEVALKCIKCNKFYSADQIKEWL